MNGKRSKMTHKNMPQKIETLLQTMKALREPQGCPWDMEQTSASLTPYIMEEACELIDAIEGGNAEIVLDELGDLLLQVVFQAQIHEEQGLFDFEDVAACIGDKLIRRHPHVFDRDKTATRADELDQQWDRIKSTEKTNNKSCLADHLPNKLPALQKAQKLISKVERTGSSDRLPEMNKSLLKKGLSDKGPGSQELNEETLGQTLFDLVKLAQDAGIDAESSLRKTTGKIVKHIDSK